MQVQAPDEDDWGKLKRVLKYLIGHGISQVGIERRCDELCNALVYWWITPNTQGLLGTDRKPGNSWSWSCCKFFEQTEMQHKMFNQDGDNSPS
jgi:hypothetical protein